MLGSSAHENEQLRSRLEEVMAHIEAQPKKSAHYATDVRPRLGKWGEKLGAATFITLAKRLLGRDDV